MTIKNYARLTGFVYLLLIPLGIFGIMYVPGLVVDGDLAKTVDQIKANEVLVGLSIAAALAIQLIHFVLVLMLYKIFKPVNDAVAKIMVLFVMVGVPIAMLNEINYGVLMFIINDADIPNTLVPLFFELHNYGVMIVGIFWGLWLYPLGYLIYKSGFMPKIIGITLMIGCFGYFIDSFVFVISPTPQFELAQYLFVGELLITLWLLIMGVNEEKYKAVEDNAT